MIEVMLENFWATLFGLLGSFIFIAFTLLSIVYLLLRAGWRSLSRSIDNKVAKFTNKGA